MFIKKLLITTLIAIFSYIGYAEIVITAVTTSQNGGIIGYQNLKREANEYFKKNGDDITFDLNVLSSDQFSVGVTDYESSLDFIFKKNNSKYDIVFYDNIYTAKFGKYLVNIEKYLPKEHVELYKNGIASKTCVYNNNYVALPVTLDISSIIYNKDLLDKYDNETISEPIPRTWDTLIENAKIISEKEKRKDILYYNGGFDDTETGTLSLYEFIYSFRKTKESGFPKFNSPEAKKALETLKKLKKEVDSNDQFKIDIYSTRGLVNEGKYLYYKFWYSPTEDYLNFSLLPGGSEGISGSILGGFNIGVINSIDDDRKVAAFKVIEYLTSKATQEKLAVDTKTISGLQSIYDDENSEVCKINDCKFIRSAQIIERPFTAKYDSWSKKFRNLVYGFLYEDKNLNTVLNDLEKLAKDTETSSAPKKSFLGIFIFLLIYATIYSIIFF